MKEDTKERTFQCEKFPPEKCKENDMVAYLLDCYENVDLEQRRYHKVTSPIKISVKRKKLVGHCSTT